MEGVIEISQWLTGLPPAAAVLATAVWLVRRSDAREDKFVQAIEEHTEVLRGLGETVGHLERTIREKS